MKKCVACGAMMTDDCKFCAQCGGGQFENMADVVVASQPTPTMNYTPVNEAKSVESVKSAKSMVKRELPKVSVGTKLLTGFFCVLLTILMIVGSLFITIRLFLSDSSMVMMTEDMKGQLAEVQVGFLEDGLDEDVTLAEFVEIQVAKAISYDKLSEKLEDGIEELLNEEFITDFMVERIYDYVGFVLYDDGEGKIELGDIQELIEDNSRTFEKVMNTQTWKVVDRIVEGVDRTEALDVLDLTKVEDENKEVFEIIRFVFSGVVEIFVAVISLLLIIGIFVLRSDKYKAFSKTGTVFIITGVFNAAVAVGTIVAVAKLNQMYPLGKSLYNALTGPLQYWAWVETAAFAAVGIVFVLIGKLLKRKYK